MNSRFPRKSATLLIASALGLSLSGPVFSQTTPSTTMDKKATATAKNQAVAARQMRASVLMGKDVRNAQNEDLGDIKDLVIDVTNGRVRYVVLSFGGFLGLGDKLFAYPVRAFKPAADRDELVLTVDKQRLKDAPGFAGSAYPDWNTPDYRTQVDRYFGSTMAPPAGANPRLVRASELLGKDVNGPDGKDLGEIEDIVINMNDGDVRYAVLEFDQSWSLRDKLFAFPLKAFGGRDTWKEDLVLNVTKDTLNKTPGFDKSNWPNINDPKWITDIDRYLVATTVIPLPSTANDALFVKLDTNRDGVLSSDEAKADNSIQANWKKIDADGNGRVSRSEFNAGYRK